MPKIIFALLFSLAPSLIWAQFKNFNTEENIWLEGVIKLEDGEIINSELNFNFVSGVLKAKNSDGETSTIYNPNRVLYFELGEDNKKALFYSLPYDHIGSGHLTPIFFEVIYQIGNEVILSRHEFKYKQREAQSGGAHNIHMNSHIMGVKRIKKVEKVYRKIYVATNGHIYPVLQAKVNKAVSFTDVHKDYHRQMLNYNEDEKFDQSKTEREEVKYKKILDKDLGILFPEKYYEIQDHIKKQKLNLNEIESWKSIIDFKTNN